MINNKKKLDEQKLGEVIKKINHSVKIYLLSSGVIHHDLISSDLSPDSDKTSCYILRKPFESEHLMGLLSTILN